MGILLALSVVFSLHSVSVQFLHLEWETVIHSLSSHISTDVSSLSVLGELALFVSGKHVSTDAWTYTMCVCVRV